MARHWQAILGTAAALPAGWREREPMLEADLSSLAPEFQRQRDACRAAGGTDQARRSQDATQSGYYDLQHYRAAIAELVSRLEARPLVIDLGCGSGRMIRLLLDAGVGRIGALDFNEFDLQGLWDDLSPDERTRVVPLLGALTSEPPVPECADAVLLIEATTGAADRGAAFASAARWLKPRGHLLLAEPSAAGYFVHALLNRDWDNIERLQSLTFDQAFGGARVRMYFANPEALDDIAAVHGLLPVARRMIPGGAALLLHALRDAGQLDARRELLDQAAQAGLPVPRLDVITYRKRP